MVSYSILERYLNFWNMTVVLFLFYKPIPLTFLCILPAADADQISAPRKGTIVAIIVITVVTCSSLLCILY